MLQEKQLDIDRLHQELATARHEVERGAVNNNGKFLELESKHRELLMEREKVIQQNSELEIKIQLYRSESEKQINQLCKDYEARIKGQLDELNVLRQISPDSSKYKSISEELEKRIIVLIEENKKLNQLLNQSVLELQSRTKLEDKLEELIRENDRLNQIVVSEEPRIRFALENQKNFSSGINPQAFWELEAKLNSLVQENEQLKKQGENNSKLHEVERKISMLVQENEKLNKLVIEKGAESQYWQERLFALSKN